MLARNNWGHRAIRNGVLLAGGWAMALLLVCATNAQTFRGAINGTVTDPSGGVVPSAQVKATETATGIDHNGVTTTDGQFSFQDLPLGTYKISVTASGFPPMTVDHIEVTAGSIYTLPVKLSLGQQATTVEVSAASLAVDTTTQTQTMTLPDQAVQDIPLNGRDFTQLISLSPGYGGYSVGGFGSLNGTRANQMNWQIDGVDNNDFWHNIPAVNQGGVSGIAGVVMPVDAIDEFSAQTQSSAEAGRNAGGTVNQVIKSGTNTMHGSAYYYNRNEFYGAASPFFSPSAAVPKKPRLRNENYGFTVGGPILKSKTFYFVGFEKQDYIIGLSGVATEPSFAWQTQALDLLNNPGGKYGSYAPVVPSTLSQNLIGNPTTNTNPVLWPSLITSLAGTLNNFFSPIASTGYSYNGIVKLDHNFNDKHHLSARWFVGQGSQTAPLGGSPALGTASSNLLYYFEVAPIHVQNYSIVLNSAFTSRLTNQILFGVNYFNQIFHDENNSFDTRALGLFLSPDATKLGKPILGAPNIVIGPNGGSFEQIGLTPPEGRNDITGMLADIVSYTAGKHQFRFGGEVRQGRVDEFYFRRGTGKFIFDGSQGPWSGLTGCGAAAPTAACQALAGNAAALTAAESLADFIAGDVQSSSIAVGNPERHVTVNGFNFFGQDAWQITRRLNVNLGLRYEYFGPLHSSAADTAVFIPGKALQIPGSGSISSLFPPDRNNFAPRLGFAYQANQKGDVVVRGGIGVYYDQINMNPFLDYRPPIAAADGVQDNPIGPSPVDNYTRLGYNWQTATAGGASIFPGITLCPTLSGCGVPDPTTGANIYNVYSVNQNFRAPYFFNYDLQIEKSLGSFAVFQIGYVGSEGRKLSVMLDINQVPLADTGTNFTLVQQQAARPFFAQNPNAGSIAQLNSIGTSNYNSLQALFRIRSWHGLTSQFAYTWAHELDEVSEYRAVFPLDSTNLKEEYGNGDFDTRHNFTSQITFDIPGASWGPKILTHGWELSSLLSFHTGQPFNINGGFNRPGFDVTGNPFAGVSHAFSKTLPGVQWVNPAAFSQALDPVTGAQLAGNLSRNKYYGPGYGDVDFSVIKNIPIRERLRVQLRAEIFNMFNRINLSSGGGAVSSGGTVTDTIGDFNGAPGIGPGEAFNLQLVAKIIF
jgi:hypothetical protein